MTFGSNIMIEVFLYKDIKKNQRGVSRGIHRIQDEILSIEDQN